MKLPGVYHQVSSSITPKTFCQRNSKYSWCLSPSDQEQCVTVIIYHRTVNPHCWIVGNKFQTGKQIPNRETICETICETIGKQFGKQIGKQMSWAIHTDTQAPQGQTMPYVEVLAEAAVVVGLAYAAIVVCSSIKSKSDTVSSSVSHVSTGGRICRCECRCMSQLQLD